jgi:hypothetical protein
VKRPYFTRKNLIVLALAIFYGIVVFFTGICIEAGHSLVSKRNVINQLALMLKFEQIDASLAGFVGLVLVAIYIAAFVGCVLYIRRYSIENGKKVCWIDELIHPETGRWTSREKLRQLGWKENLGGLERGKDYNHSSFCDLIISGLMGVQPQVDGSIVIEPLLPEGEWDWFSLSRLYCAGKEISLVYDRTGKHYGGEPGLTVYVDGKKAAHSDTYASRIVL